MHVRSVTTAGPMGVCAPPEAVRSFVRSIGTARRHSTLKQLVISSAGGRLPIGPKAALA